MNKNHQPLSELIAECRELLSRNGSLSFAEVMRFNNLWANAAPRILDELEKLEEIRKLAAAAEAERDELRAQLADQAEDTARLDWWEEEMPEIRLVDATHNPEDGVVWCIDGYPLTEDTLREAMDAVRNAAPNEEEPNTDDISK